MGAGLPIMSDIACSISFRLLIRTIRTQRFDPSSVFSEHTIAGLQIIMELGYPVQYPFGTVSTEEAHYATSNAIRLWLSEETGGPNEYSYGYTNLSGVDLDAAYNSCKVEGKIDATASESTKRSSGLH